MHILLFSKTYRNIFMSWRFSFSYQKFADDLNCILTPDRLLYLRQKVKDDKLVMNNIKFKTSHQLLYGDRLKKLFLVKKYKLIFCNFFENSRETYLGSCKLSGY